jgi:methylglutaconyl-CoA hydratase
MDPLLTERRDGIAHITINRPDVRNAFDEDLIARITDAFRSVDARAVILSGEGKVFCAGGDLNWMRMSVNFSEQENVRDAEKLAEMFTAVDECPCPVIARVHGAAFGGGLGLVCVADIAVAADCTKFCFSEVKLGLAPAVIGPFATAKIGASAARRYFLTAEVFEAEEAKRMGLVHEVVHYDRLTETIDGLAATILSNGPRAVREAKRLIRESSGMPRREALSESARSIASLRVSDEGQEGVRAFLEKRSANWP